MSSITTPHFIGSAERWGDQAFARICKVVVDSNDGINQSVMENKTDLFDIMSNDELVSGDDLGLSVAYSAIYYDQPDIIRYLHKRGIDLGSACDPMGYGTPFFYAIMMGRFRIIVLLHQLGYSLQKPCENTFYQTPLHYAKRKGDSDAIEYITKVVTREQRAKDLFHKNILCRYQSRKYQAIRRKIILLQTLYRGRLARILVKGIRSGEIVLESSSEDESDGDDNDTKSRTSLSHVEEGEEQEDEEDTQNDVSVRKESTIHNIEEDMEDEDENENEEDDADD